MGRPIPKVITRVEVEGEFFLSPRRVQQQVAIGHMIGHAGGINTCNFFSFQLNGWTRIIVPLRNIYLSRRSLQHVQEEKCIFSWSILLSFGHR